MNNHFRTARARSFKIGGGAGAIVRPGGKAGASGRACGDALLIQAAHGLFAVADSPDRNPDASREFLSKIRKWAAGLDFRKAEGASLKELEKFLARQVNRLISGVDYNANTTFTGIMLLPAFAFRTAFLMHNGDSLLYHYRKSENSVQLISRTNHCFVGRVSRVHQSGFITWHPDSRFVLATDGILDVFRGAPRETGGLLPDVMTELLSGQAASDIPELLLSAHDPADARCDDLGLMTLDPNFPFHDLALDVML